ncbi:MAG: (E)-4-hydroxy-3-methylbut-2-enyl-diphosphate synthase, partial [Muribaculaceae bacterium]|nr:(E)-4-hydroxy-3-methylbut-2-enyl-diphosphate synthase [Muribaculaceae bacterium]
MSVFDYKRRNSRQVLVGDVPMGGNNPIRLQSMTNTSTRDIDGSVAQCQRIADAGADYVRLTAQGVREAGDIGLIRQSLRDKGVSVPLIADIHFNPRAAFAAARVTDKVRINPGNFVDPGRTFRQLTYTDEQYAAELQRIENALVPFYELCRECGTAVRIGVNHGSLSDRIMSRYGDTPAGMVESAMEFLRVAVKHSFLDIVISIKASNTVIMVETVRRLVRAMEEENMDFPLHLGVTEAGDGEDGRVKSAVGIGTLLAQGIGDTIRVSLSEAPEAEIPVASALVDYIGRRAAATSIAGDYAPGYDCVAPSRRQSIAVGNVGGDQVPVAVGVDS